MRRFLPAAAFLLACVAAPAIVAAAEQPTLSYTPKVSEQSPDPSLARVGSTAATGSAEIAPEIAAERAATSPAPGLSLTSIALGEPADIAVISPDERWAYAFAQGESTLFVIDLRRQTVAKRLDFAYALWSLAISADGSRLFLSGTQPRGLPHAPCVFTVVGSVTKTRLLAVDAHSGVLLGTTPLSGVSFHAVLSPDGKEVVAVSSKGLDVINTGTRSLSRHLAAPAGFYPYAAVFAADGEKLFVSSAGLGIAVFDLATGGSHRLAPPAGSTFPGIATSVVPATDRVFTTVLDAQRQRALAVIDGRSEEITVVPEATAGGFGGVIFSHKLSRLFLPGSGLALDAASLRPVGQLPEEHLHQLTGVAGQLSADESTLYYRPFGAPEDSLTQWGDPVRYDLAIVDTRTLQTRAHFNLQNPSISCSDASPLLIGRSGRTLLALNPSLKTLSVLKIAQ